ncbi:NAD(P)/FAD-dependent oxidoreductase [Litorilituus lipolyticus]|uniref:FAD-binding oxidoreductase n=1 Tax=Litorilituus lipolyticus TaxID=2491017 RepID=A0A502KPL3_9GAMM|nr:FAD-dependent oxidoreductase [Litorilituus lipolyticus]TPH12229.1 FAD-binding oxidoreductase [Litorilituus lipolyticus]
MYDPLLHQSPGHGEPYPDSYWADTLYKGGKSSSPKSNGTAALETDIDVDVAIVGAGYTGLSCALHLAQQHGIKAHVLEANQTAWGCSGRNAGFILKSSGRKTYPSMLKTWGKEVMHGIYQEMCQGVETVNGLIAQGIDCQQQSSGFLKVAHKPAMLNTLIKQAKLQQEMFNYQVEVLSEQQVRQQYMDDRNAFGAIRYHDGFGLNPLKLALGYQQIAQKAGATIHTSSPVQHWTQENNAQVLHTPKARVTAKKVVIATNGYTPKGFHPLIEKRSLPVLSQIIVTEPLTDAQLAQCNFLTSNVVMDTRALKYYYRKLPDNRILFGGRGAITGNKADDPYYANRLLSVLKTSFPPLSSLKFDYAWSGWICMSLDDIPHIYQDKDQQVFYAMGYCGSGVSFSTQAGKRLAERVAEKELPNLPLYQTSLPKFPLAPLRRVGQWGYFHYGKIKDTYF